jgi:hypothetical protein
MPECVSHLPDMERLGVHALQLKLVCPYWIASVRVPTAALRPHARHCGRTPYLARPHRLEDFLYLSSVYCRPVQRMGSRCRLVRRRAEISLKAQRSKVSTPCAVSNVIISCTSICQLVSLQGSLHARTHFKRIRISSLQPAPGSSRATTAISLSLLSGRSSAPSYGSVVIGGGASFSVAIISHNDLAPRRELLHIHTPLPTDCQVGQRYCTGPSQAREPAANAPCLWSMSSSSRWCFT